jgi:hypothetical protein
MEREQRTTDYTDAQTMTEIRMTKDEGMTECRMRKRSSPRIDAKKIGTKNYRTLSFLSCVSWAEKIYLPTKVTKRRENFKGEDRLVHVPSAEESILLFLLVSFRVFRGLKF